MLARLAAKVLSTDQKRQFRRLKNSVKSAYVRSFLSYEVAELQAALLSLGLERGDVVMLHSAYSPFNGFRGSPDQVIDTIRTVIGVEGTLLMPSSSYSGLTRDFVQMGEVFDVRQSISAMGIVSEIFRQRANTLRSENPAHPILAAGNQAAWLIDGHDECVHSCGDGSPFAKMAQVNGKVLFFDISLRRMMFFHYLEHIIADALPFPLYDSQCHQVPIKDAQGRNRQVPVYVFAQQARDRRRFPGFIDQLQQHDHIREQQVGNTKLALVNMQDTIDTARSTVESNIFFHDVSGYPPNT